MRTDTGIADIRLPYVSGSVTPLIEATVERDYATWTPLLLSATISGNTCSDDYYDSGYKSCWWDSALNANGQLVRLGNPATAGFASGWLLGIGAADLIAADTSALAIYPYSKPGLISDGSDDFYVFYIDSTRKIRRQKLLLTGIWEAESAGETLAATPTCCAVLPISTTACFVVGYQGYTLWARYYEYVLGSNTWLSGNDQTLRSDLDLSWQDLTWCAASSHPTDANLSILVVPGGHDGCATSVIYNHDLDIFSTPFFILATTGTDWLRKVWVSGLNGPYNGRIWGVVETSLNDNGSIQHMALISTADGRSWRDEGFISELECRGKLLVYGAVMTIASLCVVMTANTIARIGTAAPSNTTQLNVQGLSITNNGQSAAQNAQLTVLTTDALLEENAVLKIVIGASVTGAVTGAAAFTGYMDSIADSFSVGKATYQIEARSSLARLIGETAYRPLTTLDWQGRNVFHSTFSQYGLPAVDLALNVDTGFWWPEYDSEAMAFCLRCTATGTGLLPLPIANDRVQARVRLNTTQQAGFVFFVDDDTKIETDRWELGLYGQNLQIRKIIASAETTLVSRVVSGYATGDTVDLVLDIMPDHITGYLVDDGSPGNWQSLSYLGWQPSANSSYKQSNSYALGVFSKSIASSYAKVYYSSELTELESSFTRGSPGSVTTTLIPVAPPAIPVVSTFYNLSVCDGGWPYSIQDALATVADIAGVNTLTHTAQVTEAEVRSLDCELYLVGAGDGLYLFDDQAELRLYATYAVVQTLNGETEYHVFNRTADVVDAYVRVVLHNNFLSLYQGGCFLCGFYFKAPRYAYTVRICRDPGQHFILPECYDPVQTGDTAWFAWDALQPADGLLSNLLQQRRIYLLETGDGTLDIRGVWPTGDILIDASNPVGSYTYYQRATLQLARISDQRNATGIVAVTDINGNRVFLLEPTMIQRTRRVINQDSQWAFTAADALREAILLRDDALRANYIRELVGFWDPALELGDTFAYGVEAWRGIVTKYTLRFERKDDGVMEHECVITAEQALTAAADAIWDTDDWGSAYWG